MSFLHHYSSFPKRFWWLWFLCLPMWIFVCCSIAQLCLTLCEPMDCSTPAFHVLHYLPELTQTHVHRVGDAIQPSRPLSSPSPPALNLSQHQGLFQWVGCSHQVIKVLEFLLASVLPMNNQGWFPLGLTGLISLQSKGFSRVFSSATVKSMNPSALSLLRGPTLTYMTTGKTIALTIQTFVG